MRLPIRMGLLIALVFVPLLAGIPLAAQSNAPLTNADVVKMVKDGLPESTIVSAITANDTQFDLSATGLQGLNEAGVSSKIIRAMLAAESKRKEAASSAPQSSPDTSSPSGMPDKSQMDAMMAQMPPAVRAQMEAAMARRGTGRPARGGPPAGPSVPSSSRPGVPIPLDSPLYTSFAKLETQPHYKAVMNMITSDPKMAQAIAQGIFSAPELTVQGNTRQSVMHMKIPAPDLPGTIDDWEVRSVVQNGRAARLLTSAAVPRYLKMSEEKIAMQMAMMDRQAAMSIAQAAAQGPFGAISAGVMAASTVFSHVEAAATLKREKDLFSWKCTALPKSDGSSQHPTTQLTDLHLIGDQVIDGKATSAYEFYAYDNEKTQGTARLFVAKDTGLPLRLEMGDPNTTGAVQMNYSELTSPVQIEVPACLAKEQ